MSKSYLYVGTGTCHHHVGQSVPVGCPRMHRCLRIRLSAGLGRRPAFSWHLRWLSAPTPICESNRRLIHRKLGHRAPRLAFAHLGTKYKGIINVIAISGHHGSIPSAASTEHGSKTLIKDRKIKGETEVTIPFKAYSVYSPYVDTDLQNRWFDFGGATVIETSRSIMLTQDRPSQAGYLWSRYPLPQPSFEIEIEFKIDGSSSVVYGDGLAIWLSKTPSQPGPVFGSIDHWDGFGVFIDTFANSRHTYSFPRIMGMHNDGYKSYDVGKDGESQEAGACSMHVRKADIPTKLKIHYVRGQFLEVLVQHSTWDEWEHCFTVMNYTLPQDPFLGFSAHTGEVSDAHEIISVSTNGLVYHPPNSPRPNPDKKHQSWHDGTAGGIGSGGLGFWGGAIAYLGWLIKWGTVLGCLGLVGFIGKKYFAQYQKETMKRF
ncbi:hypothetical protein O181_004247 [Austropuccinia psidii MF-1]|uniref:L-type lectin-like domain-containing protein n=1 Tax=Austropuccinia psidii MF-1 TaxID=1389203 RepID=A0A9Q3GFL4_9BASI|nr:hypothetical protein [Austropuccinia psidii MF-1]